MVWFGNGLNVLFVQAPTFNHPLHNLHTLTCPLASDRTPASKPSSSSLGKRSGIHPLARRALMYTRKRSSMICMTGNDSCECVCAHMHKEQTRATKRAYGGTCLGVGHEEDERLALHAGHLDHLVID